MRQQVRFAIAGTLGLLLSLVASQAFGVVRDYEILLTPQGASGTLGVHLVFGQSCAGNPHNGCINFDVDTVGVMSFRVRGNPNGLTCTNPTAPSKVAKQVITKIELTDKPSGGSGTSPKGDFSGGLAGTWLKKFAFPQVTQGTGVLYDVSVNDGLARMTLVNMNGHPELSGSKPFWYKVTVTDCATPTNTWETDPRGDNKGTN
jgi:hypothetical protein